MSTEYIASGTSRTRGAEFTVAEGQQVTVNLAGIAGVRRPMAHVQIKSGSVWDTVATLNAERPAYTIVGAGTYAILREANASAFAIYKS